MANPDKDRVQSIRKALQILRTLARQPGLGPAEIARRLGLNRATVYRLLWTLQEEGAVAPGVREGTFCLGPLFLDLAWSRSWEETLVALSLPALARLRQETGETVGIYLARAAGVVCAEILPGRYEIRRTTRPGDEMPIPRGATARCYLAWRIREVVDPEALLAGLGVPAEQVPALLAQLEAIRARGWAESWEERVPGGCAIAAPVLDGSGRIRAVVTLSGPTSRITRDRAPGYAAGVVAAAATIHDHLCQPQQPQPRQPARRPQDPVP